MLRGSHGGHQKLKFFSDSGIAELHHRGFVRRVALRVPELEVAAHAEQHHVAHQPRRGAQLGGDQHPRRGVDVDVHRVAEKDPLPAARVHGQGRHLVAERLPRRTREHEQRAFGMLGEGELVDSHRRQQFAVTGGHGDAALAVERQCCRSLEYDARHKIPLKCTLRHFSRAILQGQRKNETKINGIKDLGATPRPASDANKCPKKQGLAAPTERRSSPVRGLERCSAEGKRDRTARAIGAHCVTNQRLNRRARSVAARISRSASTPTATNSAPARR